MTPIDRDALLAELRLGREADRADTELVAGEGHNAAMAVWSEVLNRVAQWPALRSEDHVALDAWLADALRGFEQDLTISSSGGSLRGIVILAGADEAARALVGGSRPANRDIPPHSFDGSPGSPCLATRCGRGFDAAVHL